MTDAWEHVIEQIISLFADAIGLVVGAIVLGLVLLYVFVLVSAQRRARRDR